MHKHLAHCSTHELGTIAPHCCWTFIDCAVLETPTMFHCSQQEVLVFAKQEKTTWITEHWSYAYSGLRPDYLKTPLFSDFGRVEEGRWRYIRGIFILPLSRPCLRLAEALSQSSLDRATAESRGVFENKPSHLQRLRLLRGGQAKHGAKFTFMTGCGGWQGRSILTH